MKRRLLLIFAAALILWLAAAGAALAKDFRYTSWTSDVTVNKDATLTVVETLTHQFNGDFTGAYRDLNYGDNVAAFNDFSVSEGGTPYTVGTVIRGAANQPGLFYASDYKDSVGYVEILYSFRASNESKAFTIKYKVTGGFYYYDNEQKFIWPAVSEVRDQSIDKVKVTVHLPEGLNLKGDQIGLDSSTRDTAQRKIDSKTYEWTGSDLGKNSHFRVGLVLPKDYVTVRPELLARQRAAEAMQRKVRYALLASLGFSVILVVFVFLVMLLVWWKWGRDAELPPAAEYLTEPPDITPPAVVSELMDEQTEVKDINATIVDLARRGYIKFWTTPDNDTIFQWLGDKGDLRPYELQLISDIFGQNQTATLSSFKEKFYSHIPKIQKMIADESVRLGLYKTDPSTIRKRYSALGTVLLVMAGIVGCCMFGTLDKEFTGITQLTKYIISLAPGVAIGISAIIVFVFGYLMPRKTQAGAESHARWLAFQKYLGNIQQYGISGNAQDIFEKYLPYAVAFRLQEIFVQSFNAAEVVPPVWYMPYWGHGYPGTPVSMDGPAPSFDLNQMNDSLLSTLNECSDILTSAPAASSSSGGGFGGGGFGGGSGGGGGSGAW